MHLNTHQLFPVGTIKLCLSCEGSAHEINISELTTIDSLKMSEIDTAILTEKLHHKDTHLLSDGENYFIIREDILVQISHPSLKKY